MGMHSVKKEFVELIGDGLIHTWCWKLWNFNGG